MGIVSDRKPGERIEPMSAHRIEAGNRDSDWFAYQEGVREVRRGQRILTLKLTEFIWLVFGVVEGLIGLRVLFRLMAASEENPFASFIYGITQALVLPFKGLVVTPSVEGFVLEIPSIIGMLVYALFAFAIARIVWILLYAPRASS